MASSVVTSATTEIVRRKVTGVGRFLPNMLISCPQNFRHISESVA